MQCAGIEVEECITFRASRCTIGLPLSTLEGDGSRHLNKLTALHSSPSSLGTPSVDMFTSCCLYTFSKSKQPSANPSANKMHTFAEIFGAHNLSLVDGLLNRSGCEQAVHFDVTRLPDAEHAVLGCIHTNRISGLGEQPAGCCKHKTSRGCKRFHPTLCTVHE
jgi:hypothetical protein